jgi:hypothetical protein
MEYDCVPGMRGTDEIEVADEQLRSEVGVSVENGYRGEPDVADWYVGSLPGKRLFVELADIDDGGPPPGGLGQSSSGPFPVGIAIVGGGIVGDRIDDKRFSVFELDIQDKMSGLVFVFPELVANGDVGIVFKPDALVSFSWTFGIHKPEGEIIKVLSASE